MILGLILILSVYFTTQTVYFTKIKEAISLQIFNFENLSIGYELYNDYSAILRVYNQKIIFLNNDALFRLDVNMNEYIAKYDIMKESLIMGYEDKILRIIDMDSSNSIFSYTLE
jgi:hypothetical protein